MLICGFVQSTNILPVTIYLTNGTQLWYENDINGNRVRTSAEGSSNNFYFDGAGGQTEAVCLLPYSSNLTYNILGSGGDNIGQVKVLNGAVSGRYYYLKDHLGSIRMTVDVSGNVVGYDDYYPYGMQMTGRSYTSSADQRYKFVSNERDASTGYDHLGDRNYDSWSGRELSVDPFCFKYPSLSPYSYSANNPIIFYDSNGDSIDVSMLTAEQLKQYNSMVKSGMQSEDFKKMYLTLQSSKAIYNIEVGKTTDERAGGQFIAVDPDKAGMGGTIIFTNKALGEIGSVAHELYHALQSDQGPLQKGSTGQELEAFLFERTVQNDLGVITYAEPLNSRFGKEFESLLYNGFNDKIWRQGIRSFQNSSFNSNHIYDKLRPIYYSNPLISKFLK